MAFHRFDVAYCDPIASRRQQVLIDLIEDRGQVQIVESMTSVPPDVDVALIGVITPAQLQDCIDAFRAAQDMPDCSAIACHNELLLNPALWPRSETGFEA